MAPTFSTTTTTMTISGLITQLNEVANVVGATAKIQCAFEIDGVRNHAGEAKLILGKYKGHSLSGLENTLQHAENTIAEARIKLADIKKGGF